MDEKLLFLQLNNLTVGPEIEGIQTLGYQNDEIFLVIQGKVATENDGLQNHFLDWTEGTFQPMSSTHNTIDLNRLGSPNLGQGKQTYAPYGKSLSEIAELDWVTVEEGQIQIPIPVPVEGGRAYISFERPVYLFVQGEDNGKPVEPSDEDPFDVNYGTIWDKFEFAAKADGNGVFTLFSNTSCVDFVGIPSTFKLTKTVGTEVIEKGPLGFDFPDEGKKDPITFLTNQMKAETTSLPNIGADDIDKLLTPFRIYAPKVAGTHFEPTLGNPGTYLNEYIEFCWNQFTRSTDDPSFRKIRLANFVNIPDGGHPEIVARATNPDNLPPLGISTKWIAEGEVVQGELVFTLISLTNHDKNDLTQLPHLTTDPAVPITFRIPKPSTHDVLRQGGVFTKMEYELAPDTLRVEVKDAGGSAPEITYLSKIDGDIKNHVSSALNRAVMHMIPETTDLNPETGEENWWGQPLTFYAQNGLDPSIFTPNFYARTLHAFSLKGTDENGVEQDGPGKCYALAYDERHDQHVNLSEVLDENKTVVSLDLMCQKKIDPIPPFPEVENTALGAHLSIRRSNDPQDGAGVAIISLMTSKPAINADVMFAPTPNLNDNLPASAMLKVSDTEFQHKFIPGSLTTNPFRFWIRFTDSEGQHLFKTEAGELFSYTINSTPLTTGSESVLTDLPAETKEKAETNDNTPSTYDPY